MALFASWRGLSLDMLQNFQIPQINKSAPENVAVFQQDDQCRHHDPIKYVLNTGSEICQTLMAAT